MIMSEVEYVKAALIKLITILKECTVKKGWQIAAVIEVVITTKMYLGSVVSVF